ncbi:MAG: hypothetical protein ACXW2E_00600 [Nitrososphaeraceae archaeon]
MNLYQYYNKPNQLHGYQKAIITIPGMAYQYVKNVLKSPFPEGEDAIATSADYSYARDVIKGKFEKGEDAIINSIWKDKYLNFFNKLKK